MNPERPDPVALIREIQAREAAGLPPLSDPATDEALRASAARLLAAPAINADDVRRRGVSPDDPDLIALDRDDGAVQYPSFQFAPDGGMWDVVRVINRYIWAREDPWGVADWWLGENTWLEGGPPVEHIGKSPIVDNQLIIVALGEDGDQDRMYAARQDYQAELGKKARATPPGSSGTAKPAADQASAAVSPPPAAQEHAGSQYEGRQGSTSRPPRSPAPPRTTDHQQRRHR